MTLSALVLFFIFSAVVNAAVGAVFPLRSRQSPRHVLDKGVALLQFATARDSECSDKPTVSRQACLSKSETKGVNCMWLQLEDKNLCLPCEWGGVNIPCVPHGSVFAMKKVASCEMMCAHQQVLSKVSACSDVSGSISSEDCFSKGISAVTKCSWTAYTTKEGAKKSVCGPCVIEGVGTVPPYSMGNLGPEAGSTVSASLSQCATPMTEYGIPCDGGLGIPAVTNCRPTPPPVITPSPVALKDIRVKLSADAPLYSAAVIQPPYGAKEYTEAAIVAARASGWAPGTVLPPDAPIQVFGPPPPGGPTLPPELKVQFGSPPPGIEGIAANGFAPGTVAPSTEAFLQKDRKLQSSTKLTTGMRRLLQRKA